MKKRTFNPPRCFVTRRLKKKKNFRSLLQHRDRLHLKKWTGYTFQLGSACHLNENRNCEYCRWQSYGRLKIAAAKFTDIFSAFINIVVQKCLNVFLKYSTNYLSIMFSLLLYVLSFKLVYPNVYLSILFTSEIRFDHKVASTC